MRGTDLYIVIPVYNEMESIKVVLSQWIPKLREIVTEGFTALVLNDGSKDKTLEILHSLKGEIPELEIFDKPNSGHGQTCLLGYKMSAQAGAKWIFQIDSDGQCDPQYFAAVWEARNQAPVVFGYRVHRDDGLFRVLVSKIVTLFGFFTTGTWVRDANVPYRLMKSDIIKDLVPTIPADFHLANIALAILIQKRTPIKWVNIHFLQRYGGVPSVKPFSFVRHGLTLARQLREIMRKQDHKSLRS